MRLLGLARSTDGLTSIQFLHIANQHAPPMALRKPDSRKTFLFDEPVNVPGRAAKRCGNLIGTTP
jgi:hypothetical protein